MVGARSTIDGNRRVLSGGSLIRWVGTGVLALVITACAGPVQPEKQPHRIANNDPVLTPLVAETGGKRVRMARPGATVEIHARASDADGDRLRYRWVPTAGSGTVKPVSASAVRWTIGKGEGDKRLMVVVSDGRGGSARGTLRLPTRSDIVFSGMVVTNDGKPIAAAVVDVNGETATTDRRGRFRLPIEKANAPRFILNIRKWGYGLVSRIYDQSIHDGRWIVTRATVTTIDPTQPATVTDTSSQSECTGSLTSGIDWNNYPVQRIPRMIDSFGQLSGGAIPNDITQALTVIFGGTGCSPGISITIPPNSLVDAAGNPPTGTVDVAVSTVDLYAPFAMPGDYSVRVKEGARWMQSFGAGTVEIRSGNTPYRLKPGAAARLTIPVDPTQMKTGAKIPDSIPLLLYDEGRGVWQMTGGAAVDARGSAYVALIDHLSAYNTDLIKTDQACVRFKGDGLISAGGVPGEFELDVIIPLGSAAPVVRHWQISPSTDPLHADDPDLHVVINLPSNTWITFVPMRQEAGGLVPYGIFGVNSGPPQTPTDPNFPPFPYAACQNELTLTDVSGALDIVVDGAGQNFGPLPTFPYILMNAAGTDHYPVGSGEFYIFGLFDTGSNIVRISQATANVLAMGTASTTNASQNVNVRLNGMATINTTTLGAPIGPPGFPEQQAEVTGVRAASGRMSRI